MLISSEGGVDLFWNDPFGFTQGFTRSKQTPRNFVMK